MTDKPQHQKSWGWILSGCALTFVIWLFPATLIIGILSSNCFPLMGNQCITAHDWMPILVWLVLGAIAFNAAGLSVLARVHAWWESRS